MRISDWSSDVCSSVLAIALIDATQRRTGRHQHRIRVGIERHLERSDRQREAAEHALGGDDQRAAQEIGRASCRERVCQYVLISVGAVSLKKKTTKVRKERKTITTNKRKKQTQN